MRIGIGLWAAIVALASISYGQSTAQPASNPSSNPSEASELGTVTVTSDLDETRDQIAPPLGAVTYTIGPDQIQATPQGEDATFQQVLLRAPGVVEDSFGQYHIRGEHNDVAYRINGVILPEPLSGFGQELDTHLIQSVTLIDGTLPAEFGFRDTGIIDVTTKSGLNLNSNELSMYGGSYDTVNPSFEVGGTEGRWDYFVTGSYKHDSDGIENPTPALRPIHDDTDQERTFDYFSYHIDPTSRVSVLLNASYADFQIPDVPRQSPQFTLAGSSFNDSSDIDEKQNEQEYYTVVSYQKSVEDLSFQASAYSRYGQIHFTPDPVGDLIFQGVAGEVLTNTLTNGVQLDASSILDPRHTLRFGMVADYTTESEDTNSLIFDTTPALATTPTSLSDNSGNEATEAGVYAQDEWRVDRALTVNYGARFDTFNANFDNENQLSPRVNAVYTLDDLTTAHAGFARFFDPPPVQDIRSSAVAKLDNTTNAAPTFTSGADLPADPPRVERSDYYDVGISRQITKPWTVNLDGFYKTSHSLVDLGQFGDAVILSPYNYKVGFQHGAELSSTYTTDGLSVFGNFSWVIAKGKDIDTQQFQAVADETELNYIQKHFIPLDHEGEYTASGGISYELTKHDLVDADVLYGSGLRAGFANDKKEPQYAPVSLGYEHDFPVGPRPQDMIKLRVDILNVLDEVYQLRNGTGIGVNAPQYGPRRAFYVGLAYDF